jgi:hypothetical protein
MEVGVGTAGCVSEASNRAAVSEGELASPLLTVQTQITNRTATQRTRTARRFATGMVSPKLLVDESGWLETTDIYTVFV